MKKTWAVLSDILNRDIRNSVPDNMIINGLECSDMTMTMTMTMK